MSEGERIAGLSAQFDAFEKYEHERWHKLNNDLTPLMQLPEKLTREIGRMQGTFDGRIASVLKEIERTMEAAIEKAIKPISDEVAELKRDVDALKSKSLQETGAKNLAVWFLQSPLVGWIAAGVLAFVAWWKKSP